MFGLSSSTLWYLTRGSGVMLLFVLTASLVVGILSSGGWTPRRWPKFVITGLHRNLALLAVALMVIHVVTAELDPYAPLGWLATAVPFLSTYRTLWLGLGTLSADLIFAVVVTSLFRDRLGYRSWRAVHWLAYLSWPVALLHCLGTGTDTRLGWIFALEMICLVAVVVASGVRLRRAEIASPLVKAAAATVLVAFPMAVFGFAEAGPLRGGWARAAGTPTALLGPSGSARAGTANSAADGGSTQRTIYQ